MTYGFKTLVSIRGMREKKWYRTHLSVLCLFIVTLFAGCGAGRATLFVHNDGKSGINVEIEGHRKLYVGPNRHAKRHLPYGEHKITVRRGDKIIFQGTKKFSPHEDGPGWRHYLLDPDADTRFALREFYYYKDKEKAKSGKVSRKVRSMGRGHWIKVPKGACVMESMPVVLTSEGKDRVSRMCVTAK